jgi:hypothetical protein
MCRFPSRNGLKKDRRRMEAGMPWGQDWGEISK